MIAIIEDIELKQKLKDAYITDEIVKWTLNKVKGNFSINEQGLI
jgi:hypothetical protein